MTFTKLNQADLDSPRRELFNGGLGNAVALSIRWQVVFLCIYTGGPIQLYKCHYLDSIADYPKEFWAYI